MAKKSPTYWDKRALNRLTKAEQMSDEHIKRIKKIYDQAYRNVEKEIERVYANYSKDTGLDVQKLKELLSKKETDKVWKTLKRQGLDKYIKNNYKARISRLEQIQAQIYAKAKQIYPKEELEHTMAYKGVINDSYYRAVYDTQMGTGFNFGFSRIDKNMMNALLTERWSGKNYSQRIWGNTDILAESLSEVLSGAMMSGQSPQKTAKQIRERFEVSKYYAERLVRTETNHFHNTADAMAYEKLGIDKYVFVAVLDERTSEKCQSMDNKVFNYKDKEQGVNFPPLHPNCRSKTRGYLGEEGEKTLQRRARNPITKETEIIDNISYEEWAKKNGLTKKPKKVKPKKMAEPKKQAKSKQVIDIYDLPNKFRDTKTKENYSKSLVEYLGGCKSDENTLNLYKSMGKIKNIDKLNISYTDSNHKLHYKYTYYGDVYDLKLQIPKITEGIDPRGAVHTTLHESMHGIDFMLAGDDNTSFVSSNNLGLREIVRYDDGSIGDKAKAMFEEYDTKSKDIYNEIREKNKHKFTLLTDRYKNNEITYTTYNRNWNKINKEIRLLADYEERNYMDGVNSLEDIYDALSKGKNRDNGLVRYGHGSKYYRKAGLSGQINEILACYGDLKMTRTDLVEILKEDKPQLVEELDKLIDEMLKGVNK